MALEDILKRISEDAQAEADGLRSLAQAEAEAIRGKTQKQAEALRAERMTKAQERANEHAARIETLAGLELRKDLLRAKKDLIGDVFRRAEDAIAELSPDEYRAFWRPIILEAVDSGDEEIIPSARHREFFTPDFLKSLNDALGSRGRLRLSDENGGFSGGFILHAGKKETNQTIKSLIESGSDRLEPLVAAILFGKGKASG
jgi:V/A-type H+-transporting ATPase subunit E